MGDYAITKIILKIKPKFKKPLQNFIDIEKRLGDLNLGWEEHEALYTKFWESIGVSSFYYERYPFSAGSYHAYNTSLGTSDDHEGSNFYIDDKFTTRFEDGFWFVEFSSKVGKHSEFTTKVIPIIADAWVGLYGDEYSYNPTKIINNRELIVSNNTETQSIIQQFLIEEVDAERTLNWFD